MNDLRQAAQQALKALEHMCDYTDAKPGYRPSVVSEAMLGLWNALAQQEQEPVAFYVYEWVNPSDGYVFRSFRPEEHHMGRNPDRVIPVPPRREWQSLTADAVFANDKIMAVNASLGLNMNQLMDLARAIESKLKEKNNG